MINGAFGAGKTTIANELLKVVPDSLLFDPEEIGFMLRNMIPDNIKHSHERTDDFQDFELWKILTVKVASSLKATYNKNLIVPMTIHNKKYFQYIHEGFRKIDVNTYHFCLVANEKVIHNRLLARGEDEGNWCFHQTKKCIESFRDDLFHEKINTENTPIESIVDQICVKVGLRSV